MKHFFLAILVLGFAGSALADGHGNMLSFEQRQDSTEMTVTSVNLTQGGGTITAEGQMGEYGRVYLTYALTADANGLSGTVIGRGQRRIARRFFCFWCWHRCLYS